MTRALALLVALAVAAPTRAADVDPALTEPAFLYEVTRHLYRWHLDEQDVVPEIHRGAFLFHVRELHPALDEGDESRFGEIVLPRLGVAVRVKKARYEVPELNLRVHGDRYVITSVSRRPAGAAKPEDAVEFVADYAEMRDHLFRTRRAHEPPTDALLERFRATAYEAIVEHLTARGLAIDEGPQAVHLAPLSPVSNDAWVFWENGRLLAHFTSDVGFADPARWAHEELAVRLYDIDEQVVVSLDEVAGSNAYLTRDEVGRILYNCIVLGRRELIGAEPDVTQVDPDR